MDNSKLVEEGIKYLKKSENRLPFCQKELKRKVWIFIRTISDNDIQKYNIEIKERTTEIQKNKVRF